MSIPVTDAHTRVDIDGELMLGRLATISTFGAEPGPGITRTGLSAEEVAAREFLAQACRQDGLVAHTDQAGNLIVRRANADPDRPVVLLGSHLDTVVNGGHLDGTYGVIAACEVLRTLSTVDLPVEPVVVAFTNEEGAAFPYPFFGSLGLTGAVNTAEADTMTDHDGRPLRAALRAAGGDLDEIHAAAWAPGSIACYFELHIEQGPLLESRDVPIGVVEAITGRTIVDITVRGSQGHAGTTPMSLRRDALPVAAHVVLAVERLAGSRDLCAVSTVGVVQAHPNVTNVVPGTVRLTAELRDGDPARLLAAEETLVTELLQLGVATDLDIEITTRPITQPVRTDDAACRAIEAACDDLGLAHLPMFSGAGHDAQIVAAIAPVGMILVPSRDGVSHAPAEHTDDEHLVLGARTLLRSVLRLPADLFDRPGTP
ncbi:MAG TPA: Zn-dependent hydrolase [Actinophytocola sp.]|jgi:N-carbamoyl-L-amino-acid hydrolase|nr:Zn-dependent hydrolase [Actinophytocola sp.]